MPTATQPPEPTTAAPGPELTLGGPSRIGTLSAETIAKLNKVLPQPQAAEAEPAPAPEPAKATPPAATPKPAPAKAAEPAPAPAPTAKGDPAPAPAKPEEKPTKETPAQLRAAYEKAQARVAELEASYTTTAKEKADAYAKLATFETKVKEYDERITKEYEPLKVQLTETAKRLQEREEALRMRDYTATPEWHEKYVKPIADTQAEVQMLLAELRATDANGQEVPATAEHFNYVLGAPSLNEAAKRATALFGEFAAPQVVNLRSRLGALERKRQEALKTAQLESEQWAKRTEAQQRDNQQRFKAEVARRVALHLPKPAEGDAEEAAAIAEGTQLAELIEHGDPRLTPEDVYEKVAIAQARIRGEPLKELRLRRQAARIEELEKQLAAYQATEPPVETRRSNTAAPGAEKRDWKAELLNKAVAAARGV